MKKTKTLFLLFPILISIIAFTNKILFAENKSHENKSINFSYSNDLNPNDYNHTRYIKIHLEEYGMNEDVFNLALEGFKKLKNNTLLNADSILTIIDFSKPSNEKRFFVIDLKSDKILFHSLVSHGKNTGIQYARYFSNKMNSHMSSIGFYVTRNTYLGENGYSLQLDGVEKGFNDNAKNRAVVIHGAAYADEAIIKKQGYLGRSHGCPALPRGIVKQVIEKIKDGNMIFAYYPDQLYLSTSSILN